MKKIRTVPIARRTFAFYSMEDRKETVLGEVNSLSNIGRWQADAGQN